MNNKSGRVAFAVAVARLSPKNLALLDAIINAAQKGIKLSDAQSGKLDRLDSRVMEEEGGQPKVALDAVLDDPKLS